MKTMLRQLFFGASVLMILWMAGCSGGEKTPGIGKIDVAKNIQDLKSPDAAVRQEGAANLGLAGEKAEPAISALIETLKDKDPLVRSLAAYALGEIGPKASKAVPELKKLLQDPDMKVVQQTVNSLRAIDPASVPKVQMQNVTGLQQ